MGKTLSVVVLWNCGIESIAAIASTSRCNSCVCAIHVGQRFVAQRILSVVTEEFAALGHVLRSIETGARLPKSIADAARTFWEEMHAPWVSEVSKAWWHIHAARSLDPQSAGGSVLVSW